ncbi:MAG: hypothetical protein UY03_C0018G0030 [Parcubacteria group bacterium GW2011_GWA2_47_64]|nr:MAG: hypothetical protein UY03_C0018G0030 [Parcubacteria group bacterium GW2011_GWA2_47_64]KKU97166.1 MAG: hypothetical protein UY29_C0002G0063 [Parcubacteria group bacterium GW2011_GWC2_48_17]
MGKNKTSKKAAGENAGVLKADKLESKRYYFIFR